MLPAACALLAALALALLAAAPPAGAARTNDRPTTGRFTGEHSFNGTITLTFARESGIGLYVKSYRFNGTQRCEYDEVPLNLTHRTTALTAAKVRRDGRFQLNTVTLRIQGKYVGARRVQGTLTVSTLACRRDGTFAAARRR